jgi:hypothetical protein
MFISSPSTTFSDVTLFVNFFSALTTLFPLVGLADLLPGTSSPLWVEELMTEGGLLGTREGGGIEALIFVDEGARIREGFAVEREFVEEGGFLDMMVVSKEVYRL